MRTRLLGWLLLGTASLGCGSATKDANTVSADPRSPEACLGKNVWTPPAGDRVRHLDVTVKNELPAEDFRLAKACVLLDGARLLTDTDGSIFVRSLAQAQTATLHAQATAAERHAVQVFFEMSGVGEGHKNRFQLHASHDVSLGDDANPKALIVHVAANAAPKLEDRPLVTFEESASGARQSP